MSGTDPSQTSAGDIVNAALRDCGAFGVGQTPLQTDVDEGQARLQWMLQQWERKRWFVWHLATYSAVAQTDPTGQFQGKQAYTVGPGGDFDTDTMGIQFSDEFGPDFRAGSVVSTRPNRIESAFLRQLTQSQPNRIDYPLTQMFSKEDYNKIALKGLSSFPGYFFYDSSWGMGLLYPWPIPQANIYEIHISVREQLPPMFATTDVLFDIPYEYYNAMVLQLAVRLRPKFGMIALPGDTLAAQAKAALNTLKLANFQIARLQVPGELMRPQLYNIFSDRMY